MTALESYEIKNYRECDIPDCNITLFFLDNFRFVLRSKFEEVLMRIKGGDDQLSLYLLFFKNKIVGGVFWFKVTGVGARELWSPSHLIVLKEHRSYSIMFINSVFCKYRKKILDITPTAGVQSILKAMRFVEYTKGSLLVPIYHLKLYRRASSGKFDRLMHSPFGLPSGLSRKNESEQAWLVYKRGELNRYVGLKKARRYGVSYLILIYMSLDIYDADFVGDLVSYARGLCWSFILLPNFGLNINTSHLKLDRMHVWTDAEKGEIYSLVGSEITEFF